MSKEFSGIVKAWEFTVKKATAKKRAKKNIIFATMSVAHVDDDLDTPGEVYYAEKILNNGDIYTGQWSDNCPNGHGKYLWSDGCMYVGDWVKGKTMGKGKFSWPSGATYEGKFKNGYMDGEGIYTGCSNDTYRGSWVINMKHGKGTRDYVNGDHYEGEWRRGQPDGQGRYQWINGNQYIGQWRNGKMNGNGTMIWANGNRYDGSWEDGFPKGNGTFRWGDGSFYVGIWSKDTREQSGTYYPSSSRTGTFDWDPQDVHSNDLLGCQISPGERISVYPSQKMVSWPCEGEFLQKLPIAKTPKANKRNSVDGRLSNGDGYSWGSEADAGSNSVYSDQQRESSEGMRSFSTDDLDNSRGFTPHCIKIQPNKKAGTTIAKGHKNYELMLNLQLGIRHSVGRPAPATSLDLRATAFDTKEKIWTKFPTEGSKHTPPHQSAEFKWKDYCPLVFRHSVGRSAPATSLDLRATAFDTKEKIWTKFPTEGSKNTPPHQSAEFKWKDYCPLVFRTLRKLFKVDPADYMISICGNDALRELSSPGKSGSFFYLTNDDKYMIKTLKKAEVKVLLGMLPAYYNHVRAFENTLVTKFFGLHCVKLTGPAQKKVRFVIMGNLFCTGYAIHRRFDLKGSSHGRVTEKPESQIDSTTTLKDLDLNFIFRLQKVWFQEFCRQVDRDCDFLEQERIMDYSLLVGVHFREVSGSGEPVTTETRSSGVRTPTANADQSSDGSTPRLSRADMDLLFDPSGWASIRLGINMPAKAELTVRRSDFESQLVGEPTGQYYDVVLFFSIIDILQNYDISKKLEHAYKAFQYDPTSISAVDPKQYSKRFRDFILKVFAEDT